MVWRRASDVIKFLIYGVTLVSLFAFLLFGLLEITAWWSGNGLLHKLIGGIISSDSDMAAYVIAAATLELAMLTMLQQHITRQQDRALQFPDICVEKCDIIVKQEKVLDEVFGRGHVNNNLIVKMFFDKSFPVYYTPRIYRAWVRQKRYMTGKDKFYKMKVQSGYFDKNAENAIWSMQVDARLSDAPQCGVQRCSAQRCIYETAARNQVKNVQSLEFVYDVSWENQLLPWISRVFSKHYMRLVIGLEDAGKRDPGGCSIKVRGQTIKRASVCAPRF